MTDRDDLLLEEFHQAGIWLPGEGLDTLQGQNDRYLAVGSVSSDFGDSGPLEDSIWSRVQQCAINAKALRRATVQSYLGPGWVLEPSAGSASWRGLGRALARQLHCRPRILWAFIVAALVAFCEVLAW